jgi:hypothetical protein
MSREIYLDFNASTPVCPEAVNRPGFAGDSMFGDPFR